MVHLFLILAGTIFVSITHSLTPDHWLAFSLLGRANRWSAKKTVGVTALAGSGHVLTSVVLGVIILVVGAELTYFIGNVMEEITAWTLIVFGVVYALYALKTGGHAHRHEKFGHMHDYALEKQEHIHEHDHHEKNEHEHAHFEDDEHKHGHAKESKASYGFAAIIGLTPCVLMLPFFWQASQLNDWASALVVTVTFIACTLITMICMAILGLKGTMLIKSKKFEKNANILAGIIIAAVGLTIYVTETIVGV